MMPTKKPVIQCVLEDSIFRKLKVLAGKEKRSTSNIAGRIVTEYIEEYEKENGKIEIPPESTE